MSALEQQQATSNMKSYYNPADGVIANAKTDFGIVSLKGECEAEGLARKDIAREAILAARHGLGYLVKIGGCEAKGDMNYLLDIGITAIVAPMIESGFAMRKYMEMLPDAGFANTGVTIETVTAVSNIDEILEAGERLTEVTVGRSDLTASYNGDDVESERTLEMVRLVARKGKKRNLTVTMGGSISKRTVAILSEDAELVHLLDFVETRKVVVPTLQFLADGALSNILAVEMALLDLKLRAVEHSNSESRQRQSALAKRM